jgi:plasmid replication initiation protein
VHKLGDSKKLVVKSNALIEAKFKLTAREQKIIIYLISQIKKEDEDFKTYTLPIKSFSKMMGMKSEYPKYSEIREITDGLQKKLLKVHNGKKIYSITWMSLVVYNPEEGTIDFRFEPLLKPFLLQLKESFTYYHIENVALLKGSYSIRLYELLKQYEAIKERTFRLEELRELLGTGKSYKTYGNLKLRALNPAKEEINKNTDLFIDFKEVKDGRKVIKIKFIIKQNEIKTNTAKQLDFFDDSIYQRDYPLYHQINDISGKHRYSVDLKTVQRWEAVSKARWGDEFEEKLLEFIKKVNKMPKIYNPVGFITEMLKRKDIELSSLNGRRIIREEILPEWLANQKKRDSRGNISNENHSTKSELDSDEEKKKFEELIGMFKE